MDQPLWTSYGKNEPRQSIRLQSLTDKNHPDLIRFRENVIVECGGDPKDRLQPGPYQKIISNLRQRNLSRYEDIYKFTDEKWSQLHFDHIDVLYVGDEIACFAGSQVYNNWLRVAMMYFGLQRDRQWHNSILFRREGILERLEKKVIESGLKGQFFTIYTHNRQLKILSDRLISQKGIPTGGEIEMIRKFHYRGTEQFNNVTQDFFAYEMVGEPFKIEDVLGAANS